MSSRTFLCFFSCFMLLGLSCNSDELESYGNQILVLGHTYSWAPGGNRIDERLEDKDFSKYKELWLLGDVCSATTRERSTLDYLDGIFNLSFMDSKWSVGNHDVREGNIQWIEEYTQRPLFYEDIRAGYASFVLNSQMEQEQFIDSCDYKELQHTAFLEFLDKVKNDGSIRSVFVLTHNAVWSDMEESLRGHALIGNATSAWYDFLCQWASEFRNLYFDHLVEIQSSGKQVYCVAGDGGQYSKTFYQIGESGIEYYVTGINNSVIEHSDEATIQKFNTKADSVLRFIYDDSSNSFLGEFIPLDNL